jgi:PKD repeat protein
MRLKYQTGDAFHTAIELLLMICLLASCGQKGLGGSNYDQDWSIQQTADGGYVVAGFTYSNDGDVSGNRGFSDRWSVLLKPSGNMEWEKRPNGTAHDGEYCVRRTTDGLYVVAGRANSSYTGASGSSGPADPWIIRQGEINCTIAAPDTVCSGSEGNVASAAESGDTYAWSITNGAITSESNAKFISFTAGKSGTTRLALIMTKKGSWNECHTDMAITPLLDGSWTSNAPVCNGTPIQFRGPAGMDAYQWEFGDGRIGSVRDASHLYSAPGTYIVNLTVTKGGCAKDGTNVVSIAPGPDCSWTSSAPVCDGTPVQFNGPAGMDAYQWDFGDGFASVAKDPVYLYHAPGIYGVNLKATKGGCSESCDRRVEVRGLDCSWSSNAPVCNGTTVRLNGPAGMDAYQWDFGDGAVSSAPGVNHLYSAPGTYAVNLTVSKGGCARACKGAVGVKPMPDCSWSSTAPVCDGTPVQFTGPSAMDLYNWDFGDGAVGMSKDPSHLFSAPGSYPVNITVTKNGCPKTCKGLAAVKPMPDCGWTSSSPVCNGTPAQFIGPSGMDSYRWDFGDGAVSWAKDPVHIYSAPGTYAVNLTVGKGGCSASCRSTIEVTAADCSWISSSPVCNGTALQFTGPKGMHSYQWEFGDGFGSQLENPVHIYSAPGTYRVILRAAKGGCSKECATDISILPGPEFSIAAPETVCSGSKGNAASTAVSGATYAWSIANGVITSSSDHQSINFTAGESGTTSIKLTVTSAAGCTKEAAKDITITPGRDCSWTSTSPVCNRTPVQFSGPEGLDFYNWEFGDGAVSLSNDPSHLYSAPGTYAINLRTGKDSCSKDCTRNSIILPGPNCSITVPLAVCSGSMANAASTSTAGATYAWSITNGEITSPSDCQSITFTAGTSGIIRLTVNVTKEGCRDECHKDIAINPEPDSSLSSDLAAVDSPAEKPSGTESHERDGDGQVGSSERKIRIYPG